MKTRASLALISLSILSAAGPSLGQSVALGPVLNPANGHRYFRLSAATWASARAFAAATYGAELATINDAAENEWVRANVVSPGNGIQTLFGLTDAAVEGTFVWSSGQAVTYTNWGAGEPNNSGGNEDFGTINPTNGLWNDTTNSVLPSVIEIEGPINVPGEYSTIQAAINAAVDGQTILVGPGTYGRIDFGTKKLVVRSTNGPAVTHIVAPSGVSAVALNGGQGPETQLDGFDCTAAGAPGNGTIDISNGQVVRNCTVSRANSAVGIFIGGSAIVDGCLIAGSTTAYAGIGIRAYVPNAAAVIQNCTIVGFDNAVRMFTERAERTVKVVNCILVSNVANFEVPAGSGVLTAIFCNTVGNNTPGVGNINVNPLFVNAPGADNIWGSADDNFRLQPTSPCIDSGSNTARASYPVYSLPLDIYNGSRFVDLATRPNTGVGPGPIVDMGAVEFQPSTCPADFNNSGAASVQDLFDFLSAYFSGCP